MTDVFLDQKRVNVCEQTVKTWYCLYRVFIKINSLLIEKDICDLEMFQVSFRVFMCAFNLEISSFFW